MIHQTAFMMCLNKINKIKICKEIAHEKLEQSHERCGAQGSAVCICEVGHRRVHKFDRQEQRII